LLLRTADAKSAKYAKKGNGLGHQKTRKHETCFVSCFRGCPAVLRVLRYLRPFASGSYFVAASKSAATSADTSAPW
jgi:hypothetical protein